MTRGRQALRALSTLLLLTGAVVLADVAVTVAWQEPLTALVARLRQDGLRDDLDRLEREGATAVERRRAAAVAGAREQVAILARGLRRRTPAGAAIGRLRIPAIGVDRIVVDGAAPADLRKGPGVYPETPLPGGPGTSAIAGHRTTYGAPFRRLDDVGRGDAILVDMPYARLRYRVEARRVVAPDAVWVLRRVDHDRLVLSACHPRFSAARRLVVFARLVDVGVRTRWTSVGASGARAQELPARAR